MSRSSFSLTSDKSNGFISLAQVSALLAHVRAVALLADVRAAASCTRLVGESLSSSTIYSAA